MIDPVIIRFATAGIAEVGQAFDTVTARMRRFEEDAQRHSERGRKQRVTGAEQEATSRIASARKTATEEERLSRQKEREDARLTKYLEGVRRKSSEMAGRLAVKQANEEMRESKRAAREVERLEEYKMRVRIRSSEMAGRIAAREAAEEVRAQERAAARMGRIGRRAGGMLNRSVGGLVGSVGTMAGATLGIGGGFLLADIGRQEMEAQRTAGLLVNAVTTGGAPPQGANVSDIVSKASEESKRLGVSKEDLLRGALEYSRKARGGDFAGTMANMGFFAKMSQVTGADITDIAAAAGTLQSQNQNLKAPQMQQMLLDVYAQGKAGSMSMVDVAKQIGILGSTRSAYAGDAATNQRKLLALGQLAAPEGSVEEAGTFIKDLSMEAGKHRKSTKDTVGLEAMGVRYNQYGQLESPEQMIGAVLAHTKGDITQIEKIFGARGTALFRSLQPAFVQAGGGSAGLAAVQAKMASVTGATMTAADLEAQHQQLLSTPAEKFAVAANRLKEVIAEKLTPWMERFADKLPDLIPKIERVIDAAGKFAEWFADNPIKGVGAIVLAAISKDLAAAGIGAGVKAVLESLVRSAAASGMIPGVGGGSGSSSKLAGALGIVGATAGVALVANEVLQSHGAEQTAASRATIISSNQGTNVAGDLFAKARAGNVTAADVANAQQVQQSLQTQLSSKQKDVAATGAWNPWTGLLGNQQNATNLAGEAKNLEMALKQVTRALQVSEAALKLHAETASNVSPNNPARGVPINQRPVP